MRRPDRRVTLCVVLACTALLLVPGSARAATTYDIEVGQAFFEAPAERFIPGYSLRIYPSSIKIQKNDVLHFFGFGAPILHQEGEHPEEWIERNRVTIGDPFYDIVNDPDEGPDAYKFNNAFETASADCTSATDPCDWNGQGAEIFNPGNVEDAFVRITANPGTVIYGSFVEDSYIRIEVVSDAGAASTQEQLDARAAQMKSDDYNLLAATHHRFSSRRTSHVTPQGRRVWDAWAGIDRGPMSLEAMYPRRMRIRRGDTVQWHFDLQFNAHTVTLPFKKGVQIFQSYDSTEFGLVCDPDGDNGTAPDTPPTAQSAEDPPCTAPAEPEFDLNPRELFPAGNGVFAGASDFEHSGVRTREALQPGFGDEGPMNVRFRKRSTDKGFRYICTIHGPFMSGRVIVR